MHYLIIPSLTLLVIYYIFCKKPTLSSPCHTVSRLSPFQSESKTRLKFREDDLFPTQLTHLIQLIDVPFFNSFSILRCLSLYLSISLFWYSLSFLLFRTNHSQKQRIWPGLRQRHHRFLLLKLQEYMKVWLFSGSSP